jgi:hypothetical protein
MCFKIGGASSLSFRIIFSLLMLTDRRRSTSSPSDAQTWPRRQSENLGIPKNAICLIFASMGQMEHKGLDFISKNCQTDALVCRRIHTSPGPPPAYPHRYPIFILFSQRLGSFSEFVLRQWTVKFFNMNHSAFW